MAVSSGLQTGAGYTPSETCDVGFAPGSPVSLDYSDRAPFGFNGEIGMFCIGYVVQGVPKDPGRAFSGKRSDLFSE